MTSDRIRHYIGDYLFYHIGSLDKTQLMQIKGDIIKDMEILKDPLATAYFYKKVELELVNKRLDCPR